MQRFMFSKRWKAGVGAAPVCKHASTTHLCIVAIRKALNASCDDAQNGADLLRGVRQGAALPHLYVPILRVADCLVDRLIGVCQ